MRDIRVFVELPLAEGREFVAPEALAHYAKNVLRLGQGDALRVFDGSGPEFSATITAVSKKELRILAGAPLPSTPQQTSSSKQAPSRALAGF